MLNAVSKLAADADPGSDEVERLLRLLREAPLRIAAATDGLDASRLHERTADEPWSINDVVAHVRAAADNRERYIDRMWTGQHPTLGYQSARSELAKTDYLDLPFAQNLAAYRSKRAALVERLEAMPIDHWSRVSLIRDRPETVATYVHYLTDHDTAHAGQIEILARIGGPSNG